MFERRHQKVAPAPVFLKRLALCFGTALLLILAALFIGIAGYHWIAGLTWIDSLLNASMILGGMGPVDLLTSTGGKVFASAYALFSGLVFIAVMGVVFSPLLHRMLHKFHMDDKDLQK
ncbi:MAG: hypothetical protein V1673_02755 [Candidatus Omnitrophota bacterium]